MKNTLMILVLILISTVSFTQKDKSLVAKATVHQVSLSWQATTSSCSGTLGYNIYRGTTSGQEGTNPINSAVISGLSYTDTTVSPLVTYYYTAKTSCSTSSPNLSGPSNEVNILVPGDPQPAPPVMNPPTAQ